MELMEKDTAQEIKNSIEEFLKKQKKITQQ
jgi:hypothetical protein